MRVMDTVNVESPLQGALNELNELLPAVQRGQLPDPEQISRLLMIVEMGKAELMQEMSDLKNPARFHVEGEMEAYLDLKHSLADTIPKLNQLENHLMHVRRILPQ